MGLILIKILEFLIYYIAYLNTVSPHLFRRNSS